MKKNNNFFSSNKFLIIIFSCVGILCILDIFDIPSKLGFLTKPVELNSWVSLAITSLFVIFSAVITIRSVILSIQNQETQRKEDNEKAVLPMGKIEKPSEQNIRREEDGLISVCSIYNKKGKTEKIDSYKYIKLNFKNVGVREMYNTKIKIVENEHFSSSDYQELSPIIYSNDAALIAFNIATKRPVIENNSTVEDIGGNIVKSIAPIIFDVYYTDCYGDSYKQRFQVEVTYRWFRIIETKKTYKDFENPELAGFKVVSAPEKV